MGRVLQNQDTDEFGISESQPCGVVFPGMLRAPRMKGGLGTKGALKEEEGPSALTARVLSRKELSHRLMTAALCSPPKASRPHESQMWPQETICALDDMSTGPGTPRRCDLPKEPSE